MRDKTVRESIAIQVKEIADNPEVKDVSLTWEERSGMVYPCIDVEKYDRLPGPMGIKPVHYYIITNTPSGEDVVLRGTSWPRRTDVEQLTDWQYDQIEILPSKADEEVVAHAINNGLVRDMDYR